MNRVNLVLHGTFIVLYMVVIGHSEPALCQTSVPPSSAASQQIQQIMSRALSRCHSSENGVNRITFVSPTDADFAEVTALGPDAVAPLAAYLDAERKDGLTQLLAVKFLTAIGSQATLDGLKRAFAQDQWEVARAAALSGMFAVSQDEANHYVEEALADKSQLVRQRAQELWSLYQRQKR